MSSEKFENLILPSQRKKYYDGKEQDFFKNLNELIFKVSNLEPISEQFKIKESEIHPLETQASSPINMQMIKFLILSSSCKKILEIGSFIGASAMAMASVLPPDGKVITIEKFDHFSNIALENIKNNGFKDKIQLLTGDAFELINSMDKSQTFDFIFLDGNKERYNEYFLILDKKLQNNGIMIIDDVIFDGDVLNENCKTEKALGIKEVLNTIENRKDYFKFLLPLGNGMLILFKYSA